MVKGRDGLLRLEMGSCYGCIVSEGWRWVVVVVVLFHRGGDGWWFYFKGWRRVVVVVVY
ncbi:hypothetical protein HanIR_Chr13g0664501 [Helianthus annuus]|nr:hypothetical protein HanIR_Chr13g0664501 [Helianthus annuus]